MEELEGREEKKIDLHEVSKFITKNRLVYVICFLALMGSFYTLYNVGDYQKKCNDHWVEQFESKGCSCNVGGIPSFNDSFRLQVPFVADTDDKIDDEVAHILVPNNSSTGEIGWP